MSALTCVMAHRKPRLLVWLIVFINYSFHFNIRANFSIFFCLLQSTTCNNFALQGYKVKLKPRKIVIHVGLVATRIDFYFGKEFYFSQIMKKAKKEVLKKRKKPTKTLLMAKKLVTRTKNSYKLFFSLPLKFEVYKFPFIKSVLTVFFGRVSVCEWLCVLCGSIRQIRRNGFESIWHTAGLKQLLLE